MTLAVAITLLIAAASVAATLLSEARAPLLEWLFKPLAALCFVALALQLGATESTYGRILLVGLVLCLCGDVLLIARKDAAFLLGLTSFLLGHVAYAVAFLQLPFNASALIASLLPVLALGLFSLRWLWPQLPGAMRVPVGAYVAVICAMLLMAGSAWGSAPGSYIVIGAWGFALSDLSVARNQFVHRTIVNRLWGLPLYFASQLLLAWSVSLPA